MRLSMKVHFPKDPAKAATDFIEKLFEGYPRNDFQICLWDGSRWGNAINPRFRLVLKHPGTLRSMFTSPSELGLGEAYIFDDFDIEGDIEAAFGLADYLLAGDQSLWRSLELAERMARLPANGHSPARPQPLATWNSIHSRAWDQSAVRYHYDLPAEFYALWLDRRMVYSSAYFEFPQDDLDAAQQRKLDYICRKLRLRPGERLLDIGCGWGGLVVHAAAHYGAQAVGITLSVPQAELARRRVRESGLNDSCRIEVADYRDLEHGLQYDKIVSVGMFEHVGESLLPEYFSRAWHLLRPGGVFLNHGISYSATYRRKGPSFIDRYVFPGSELVPIHTSIRAAELSGFELRDVENLREHYALTLHHWLQRLQEHAEEARYLTTDTTYRIWRLYMAGAVHAFRNGRLNLFQTLFAKPQRGECGLPLTRQDWYTG